MLNLALGGLKSDPISFATNPIHIYFELKSDFRGSVSVRPHETGLSDHRVWSGTYTWGTREGKIIRSCNMVVGPKHPSLKQPRNILERNYMCWSSSTCVVGPNVASIVARVCSLGHETL